MDSTEDFDVAEALRHGDEQELTRVWSAYHDRRMWQQVIAKNTGDDGNAENLVTAHRALARLPKVTALDALEANRRLVDLLVGRRWYVMQDAREEKTSWAEIGDALGISRQGAYDFYRRAVEDQERYVPGFLHDASCARVALGEPAGEPGSQHEAEAL